MKKVSFIFGIVFLFFSSLIFSQTITVTSPHSGDVWYKGNTRGYTIRWTKSGAMNANVKIRLYQGEEKVVGIVDSTPNDGEYTWIIPASVNEGSYYIRVKTVDNEVFDNGEEFEIRNGAPPEERASITVTSPHRGNTWYKGRRDSYTIRWTKSGTMNANVKIRLYQGRDRVLGIVDSTPNDGSYDWTIPDIVDEGEYYIRVKTVDNEVFGDGENFNIGGNSGSATLGDHLRNRPRALRDFEMKDIYFVHSRGGWLVAKIKNYANNFNDRLKFRCVTNHGHASDYVKDVNMTAGEEKVVYLTPYSTFEIPPFCGVTFVVRVDPDNDVEETNERNNVITKKLYVKTLDLSVRAPRKELRIWKVYGKISHRWRIKFKIKAKATGRGFSTLSNVYVRWQIYNGNTEEPISPARGIYGPLTLVNNVEKVITIDRKFGHPNKKFSIRPRLKEGFYLIKVFIEPRNNGICETINSNNSDGLSFNLR